MSRRVGYFLQIFWVSHNIWTLLKRTLAFNMKFISTYKIYLYLLIFEFSLNSILIILTYRNNNRIWRGKKEFKAKMGKKYDFLWIGGEFKEAKVIEITLHCACFYVLAFVVSPFPILHFEAEILRWRRSGSQTPMEGTSTNVSWVVKFLPTGFKISSNLLLNRTYW